MRWTATNYLRLLQSLLPGGAAWNRDEDSTLTEFLLGVAEELARVDGRSADLAQERDTRYTSELLEDHESDLGLPDECSEEGQTIPERRSSVHTRLISLGGQNPAYFIELAATLGWTITITEYTPFWCGVHGAGDPCGDQKNIFYWKVTITYGSGDVIYFMAGSGAAGDPLSYIPGTDPLICILRKYKPGHTILTFDFDGPAFAQAFSSAFDSLLSDQTSHLQGAFNKSFGLGFDVNYGGDFDPDAFDVNFHKPG